MKTLTSEAFNLFSPAILFYCRELIPNACLVLISSYNLLNELSGISFAQLQIIAKGGLMEFINWKENGKI